MEQYHDVHKRLNDLRRITKYGLIVFSLGLTAHCGLLYFGYDLFIIHFAACVFALWLGLSLSRVYNLCWAHKLCVIYISIVLMCIVMRRHGIFDLLGMEVKTYRGAMFIVGVIIQILVIWRATQTKTTC